MADLQRATEAFLSGFFEGFQPDPLLMVSGWADARRFLSSKAASEPGQWRTDRTPYLREPMDVLSPHDPAERIVMMFASQTGKTESGNNWIGYVIDYAPGPMLMVQPTEAMVKKSVRQRIDPMIADSPTLREKVGEASSRSGSNNLFMKDFPGGMLLLTGANSAASLASMPIRYLFADEVDRWPYDVEGEGDPLGLAERRTTNFRRRKILITSTPTIKGASRIEREFKKSDQRRYFVPCPHCAHMQTLRWRDEDGTFRLRFDRDENGNVIQESVLYVCESCETGIEEWHKTQMLMSGRWIATAPGDGKTIGFHLNALYSPLGWKRWSEIVQEFLEAKDYPELLKQWMNTVLAETWEDEGLTLNANVLAARLENWPRLQVPAGGAVLVNAVDVQGDRLEAKTIAFGAGEESWLVDYDIMWGDPSTDHSVWEKLDEWRQREYVHETTGRAMRASITLIDSGSGNHQDAVYDFVGPRQAERVFAIKGKDYLSRPGLAMESTTKKSHIRLFLVATHAAKDRIFSRLRVPKPGPGYMHLPNWIPEQYLDQMTAEKKIVTKNKRTGAFKIEYQQTGRNEAFDLEVYCLAGLFILQTFIAPQLYRDLGHLHEMLVNGALPAPQVRQRRIRSSGVTP